MNGKLNAPRFGGVALAWAQGSGMQTGQAQRDFMVVSAAYGFLAAPPLRLGLG